MTAWAASLPFFFLAIAWRILRQVIIPFPIGFLFSIDNFIMASVEALEIKSKCGVWPFITQPNAKNPSYFLIFFDIVTGISNTPGTFKTLMILDFGKKSFALLSNPFDIYL